MKMLNLGEESEIEIKSRQDVFSFSELFIIFFDYIDLSNLSAT